MTIPTKPDFAKAYQSANEILVTSSVITKFPFSIKEKESNHRSEKGNARFL